MNERRRERGGALAFVGGPRHLRRDLDEILDEMLEDFRSDLLRGWYGLTEGRARMPAIDVKDKGTEIEVVVEMPGVPKDAVEINMTDDALEISAEAKGEEKEEDEGYLRRERYYTSFYRRVPMPGGVRAEKGEAEMVDGILRIRIPKEAGAKGHRIKVK